jgi:hypothetical protein
MNIARLIYLVFVCLVLIASAHGQSFLMNIYVVPPPDRPVIDFRIDLFDPDDNDANLGGETKHVDGSTSVKVAVAPNKNTKRVKVKFEPLNFTTYKVKPAERIIDLAPIMQAKTVTWIASIAADKAYLDNVTTAAGSLRKKDIDEAIDRAAYAGAVAETDNQRLEAARVEANGFVAKNDPISALAVIDRVASAGIDKADPGKKKVFVGEWLDILELAAATSGFAPDKDGLIFASIPPDSKLGIEFQRFADFFATIVPKYKDRATRLAKSDTAGREKAIRSEMWTILKELNRRNRG